MTPAAAFPQARLPHAYIGPKETTLRKSILSILEKIAFFGMLLGSGMYLAGYYTANPILILAGVSIMSFSTCSCFYNLIQALDVQLTTLEAQSTALNAKLTVLETVLNIPQARSPQGT